ncbi:very short patch repair endonuclease [Arthrobacter sp. StoSoilA2]|uniref:very short patch repair endonuclease n=1 Tax=Arthrobacter sp. StoSoilA2 TaxID=2830990 RepID=UPI001CC6FC01|nr:very short patch repair endonuclease [Arthrobacter sp. StoSoilA2]BCW35028.1 very short patch repair endonuclease [Arthrobacter sp. StoSoilA2]
MGESRDLLTPEQRSRNMSRIRGKNTKPELLVRKLLHAKGYRYRLHGQAGGTKLPGRPDLVFSGRRKVIFVNGCFWHFHDCKVGLHSPTANAAFWETKRTRTRERDQIQREQLRAAGWDVLTVWECELRDSSVLEERLTGFLEGPLEGHSPYGAFGPAFPADPAESD